MGFLAFDLPDYSKSSAAQTKKLERRETQTGGRRTLLGLDIHDDAKPNSSPFMPRASRRFGWSCDV